MTRYKCGPGFGTRGETAYRLRAGGMSWGDIAVRLVPPSLQCDGGNAASAVTNVAKKYARSHGREWPIKPCHETRAAAAVVLLCEDNGRILAISRRGDKTRFGLPGGKVEPADGPALEMETLQLALSRELREEVGVEIRPEEFRLEFQHPDKSGFLTYCFSVGVEAVRHASTQEGEGEVCWVSWETLEKGPFGEYNSMLRAHMEEKAHANANHIS